MLEKHGRLLERDEYEVVPVKDSSPGRAVIAKRRVLGDHELEAVAAERHEGLAGLPILARRRMSGEI